MDRLPSTIMVDIFSRVPTKCLARSRCVSKVWRDYIDDRYLMTVHDKRVIEEPTPILYHSHRSHDKRRFRSLCFHVIESKQTEARTPLTYALAPKEYTFLEFVRNKRLSKASIMDIEFRGSCNGLMCFVLQEDGKVTYRLLVVNPLWKECYEVPPLPMCYDSYMSQKSCGLGFDASTNTLKMVFVLLNEHAVKSNDHDMVRKNLCTMVHEIGTNSWREIPQVLPPYLITDGAIFANGCLHWLVRNFITEDGGYPLIRFDVIKEEFVQIVYPPPKIMYERWISSSYFGDDHLVDLNGEVGYVCARTMGVWVLKQKEWVAHCRMKSEILPDGHMEVLGCWNRDGDMLIRNLGSTCEFFIYNLKSDVLHKTNIVVPRDGHPNILMHPNKLFSIHGIGANSFPTKKTDLNYSCDLLLSCNKELEI